jgi:hypothetical protein
LCGGGAGLSAFCREYTYSLAIESEVEDDQGLHYWAGGQVWSKYPEDAASFASMDKAEATIEVFQEI